MSTFATSARPAQRASAERIQVLAPLVCGATILASACLLFLVQPLISKLILPWFGGSAAVWITCMLFFQAGLLVGYSYAHALTRRFKMKRQAGIHLMLLALSLAALPIVPNPRWQPRAGEDPTWLVLGALAASIGLPYVLLSSTTPLVQSWFAAASESALPYRYFALSNAGSLAALLAYPVFIEPYFTGREQAWMWSLAFTLFAALCGGTAVFIWRGSAEHGEIGELRFEGKAGRNQILLWVSLAACGSTLLVTVTNLLTQNVAAVPLLWVVPLSIYLLTFMVCFESDRWYRRIVFLPLVLPALGCLVAGAGPLKNAKIPVEVPLLSAALFVCATACHGELARLRPAAHQLTSFYLWLAGGGALGGIFVGLVAPHIFNANYEYPIAFVSSAALLLLVLWRERDRWKKPDLGFALWMGALTGTVILAAYAGRETWHELRSATVLRRNFYGPLRVEDLTDHQNQIRELSHGTIIHGLQFREPMLRDVATSYYSRDSGIGLTWRILERGGPVRMGIVGLGAGTLAAYGRAGDTLRFYEINPLVIELAKTQFTFLSDCPAHIEIVPGDARLSLAREPNQRFDVLVIDAFSGDAIPIHLLTREAFAIYWRHLKPDGVLAVHVSNRYLNLAPVVLLSSKGFGKQVWEVDNEDDDPHEIYAASYVLATSRANFFDDPLFKGELLTIDVSPGLRAWTDDYSNLWQVLNYK